uniref:Bm5181, isoform c n=1 Tax=Brugia malayi TaxID=6279 RepID=A0A1I9G0K0_BRUMA|nr:Bm5181, isoform c [Brugia malayi]
MMRCLIHSRNLQDPLVLMGYARHPLVVEYFSNTVGCPESVGRGRIGRTEGSDPCAPICWRVCSVLRVTSVLDVLLVVLVI